MNSMIQNTNGTSVFTRRASGNILDVNKQWASRSADEAVFTVDELLQRTAAARDGSVECEGIPWAALEVIATPGGGLALRGNEAPVHFNHFSLGQFCALPTTDEDHVAFGTRSGIAPHTFISKLHPETAAAVLNERLHKGIHRKSDAQLLVQDDTKLRCITTDKYARVWDHELALRVADLCDNGTWQPAEAFKRAGDRKVAHAWGETSALPLGWVGDRSMYVCLVDYEGSVEHNGNQYARFFLLSNSEVGASTLKITFGLMDFACCNFILWGCHEVWEASFMHTGSVRDKWQELSEGINRQLASDTRVEIVRGMDAASSALLGGTKDEVISRAQKVTSLPKKLIADGYSRAEATPRYGDPNSVWGMLNGLTEASQHAADTADKRTGIDAKAAKLMSLV